MEALAQMLHRDGLGGDVGSFRRGRDISDDELQEASRLWEDYFTEIGMYSDKTVFEETLEIKG